VFDVVTLERFEHGVERRLRAFGVFGEYLIEPEAFALGVRGEFTFNALCLVVIVAADDAYVAVDNRFH
jgi:hypothetical protein